MRLFKNATRTRPAFERDTRANYWRVASLNRGVDVIVKN
jgi:hypothetical protein